MENLITKFNQSMPIIAILRGIKPSEITAIGDALIKAKITIIEVPLNSPDAFTSIELLAKNFKDKAIIGAGTVLSIEQVEAAKQAGAEIIVAPNVNKQVIQKCNQLNLLAIPGIFTPSEAFAALAYGAFALKIFPANMHSPESITAINAVLPEKTKLFIVGGCNKNNIKQWQASNVAGFGIGSTIYQPNYSPQTVYQKTKEFVTAYENEK